MTRPCGDGPCVNVLPDTGIPTVVVIGAVVLLLIVCLLIAYSRPRK
jgi:hypothetical protein